MSGKTDADSRKSAGGKKSFATAVTILHLPSSLTLQTILFFIPVAIRFSVSLQMFLGMIKLHLYLESKLVLGHASVGILK